MTRTRIRTIPFDERRKLLLDTIEARNLALANVSKLLGKNHAYLHQYIVRGKPRVLPELERKKLVLITGLTEEELGKPAAAGGALVNPTRRTVGEPPQLGPYEGPAIGRPGVVVPIHSAAQGGKGHWIIDFTPIEYSAPPEDLRLVRNAYGILIKGESMVPAYWPGDIAWVHPSKQPQRDSAVVLYHTPPHGGEVEAIIKTYLGAVNGQWQLRQWNPPMDFNESIADWPICHVITGKKNK